MIQHISCDGIDVEMTMCTTGNDDFIYDATSDDDHDDVSTDGIIKDEEQVISTTKPNTRRRQILSLSIGLSIGAFISMLVFVTVKVRNGGMMQTNHNNNNNNIYDDDFDLQSPRYASIIQEETVCRKYPRSVFMGKKGVALQLNDNVSTLSLASSTRNVPILQSLRPYWNYGWNVVRSSLQPDDIEWVPMVWGGHNIDTVKQRIETYVLPHIQSGKVKRILGYNEPDGAMQANMTVETAIALWPALESTSVALASPSCALPGREWMQSFMTSATNSCKRVDWVAVHWYGSANFISFRNTIRSYYQMYGKKQIIITEFAPADFQTTTLDGNANSREEVLSFMKQALPWLESRSWIVGYAWFPYGITDMKGWTSALYDETGQLTPLGQYYASVRAETPNGNQTIRW